MPEVEVAALLVDATGRVGGDGDLVVRQRRAHTSGAVRFLGQVAGEDGSVADWLEIDTARVDPGVQRIVITASSGEGTFGQVPGLLVRTVGAGTGELLALYVVEGATTEKAFVLGEFYRRGDAWRFRAVGQGYDSGLTGLAEDHGIAGEALEGARDPGPGSDPGPGAGPVLIAGVAKVSASGASASRPAPLPGRLVPSPAAGSAHSPAPALASDVSVPAGPAPEAPAPTPAEPFRLTKADPSARPFGEPSSAAGLFGEDFPEFVLEGSGSQEFAVDEPLPTGFYVVDTERSGDGSFMVESVDDRPGLDLLAHTRLKDFRGRTLRRHDGSGPIRLRVHATDRAWKITFRPVSVIEELGRGATGRGRDVLLHTGPAAELRARLRPEHELPYFQVECNAPRSRGIWDADVLVSESYKQPEYRLRLPEGPVLVRLTDAEGAWSLEVLPTS
ncbi:TerD family protein [Streptomyces sp. NPDC058955]|uniref:TerD family protein n=1 Tax=unclassified Streptomyces TaxID=2593676 RepID=UPI003650C226